MSRPGGNGSLRIHGRGEVAQRMSASRNNLRFRCERTGRRALPEASGVPPRQRQPATQGHRAASPATRPELKCPWPATETAEQWRSRTTRKHRVFVRSPVAEDDCSERQVSDAVCHTLGKRMDIADRQEHAAEARQRRGIKNAGISHLRHRDACLVRCTRIGADCVDGDAERRVSKQPRRDRHQQEGDIDECNLLEHG